MIYGYARVSTDGQSLDAQVKQLRAAGAEKVVRETASGAKTDRAQLRRVLGLLEKGDVLTVTRLDRLARSTRDLLNTLATITGKGAGFHSLNDTWADTTTAHGRLMLTVLGGLAEPANRILQERIGHLLTRPIGCPPNEVRRSYANFTYQAGSWTKSRRLVAKVEWHPGELYPRVGFIVTRRGRRAGDRRPCRERRCASARRLSLTQ